MCTTECVQSVAHRQMRARRHQRGQVSRLTYGRGSPVEEQPDVHLLHRTCHNGALTIKANLLKRGVKDEGRRGWSRSSDPRGTSNISVISILTASILAATSSSRLETLLPTNFPGSRRMLEKGRSSCKTSGTLRFALSRKLESRSKCLRSQKSAINGGNTVTPIANRMARGKVGGL